MYLELFAGVQRSQDHFFSQQYPFRWIQARGIPGTKRFVKARLINM